MESKVQGGPQGHKVVKAKVHRENKAQGPQGKGEQGPQGNDGTGVNILGSYNTLEDLQREVAHGSVGDAYLVDGVLYIWSLNEDDWVSVGNIKGPQGSKGAQGSQGAQGSTGTTR